MLRASSSCLRCMALLQKSLDFVDALIIAMAERLQINTVLLSTDAISN